MKEPVTLIGSGNTYEKSYIIKHLDEKHTDPLTNKNLFDPTWYANQNLKSCINEHKEKFVEKFSSVFGIFLFLFQKFKKNGDSEISKLKELIESGFELLTTVEQYFPDKIKMIKLEESFLSLLKNEKDYEKFNANTRLPNLRLSLARKYLSKGNFRQGLNILIKKLLQQNIKVDESLKVISNLLVKNPNVMKEKIFVKSIIPITKYCIENEKENTAVQLMDRLLKEYDKNKIENSIEINEILLMLEKDFKKKGELTLRLGKLYLKNNDMVKSERHFEYAANVFHKIEAYKELFNIYEKNNNQKRIIEICERITEKNIDTDIKIEFLKRTLKHNQNNQKLIEELCNCYIEKKDFISYQNLLKKRKINVQHSMFNYLSKQTVQIKKLQNELDNHKLTVENNKKRTIPIPFYNQKQRFVLNFSGYVFKKHSVVFDITDEEDDTDFLDFDWKIKITPCKDEGNIALNLFSETDISYHVLVDYSFETKSRKSQFKRRLFGTGVESSDFFECSKKEVKEKFVIEITVLELILQKKLETLTTISSEKEENDDDIFVNPTEDFSSLSDESSSSDEDDEIIFDFDEFW